MTDLMNDLQKALDAKLWVIALHAAFILPDVNAAVASEDGEASGQRYRDWYDKYILPKYPLFTSADAWRVRCKLLHQGLASSRTTKKIFFTTADEGVNFHRNVFEGTEDIPEALSIDIGRFCTDMLEATEQFHLDEIDNPVVATNLHRSVRWTTLNFHPDLGIPAIKAFTSDIPDNDERAETSPHLDIAKLKIRPIGPHSVATITRPDGTTRNLYSPPIGIESNPHA